jgi:dipeptidase D
LIRSELPPEDNGFQSCACQSQRMWVKTLTFADTSRVISMLTLFPRGPQAFSRDMPGLVETSANLGVVSDNGSEIAAQFLLRSSIESRLDELSLYFTRLARVHRASCRVAQPLPGLAIQPKLRAAARNISPPTTRLTDRKRRDAAVECTHAGPRVRHISSARYRDWTPYPIGPDLYDLHTPAERVDLRSWERFL